MDNIEILGNSGKRIASIYLDDDFNSGDGGLIFEFEDGSRMAIHDNYRQCCERRWMHTDDDLPYFVGSALQNVEVRKGEQEDEDGDGNVRESAFLIITTDRGQFTIVNYNRHNGYYGGFRVVARLV